MKNVAFFMYPVKSHTMIAFGLANQFQKKGYQVIFFGGATIQQLVEKEGFIFHQISFIEEINLTDWKMFAGVFIKSLLDKAFIQNLYRSYISTIYTWEFSCKQYDIEFAFIDDGLAECYYILKLYIKKVFVLNPRLSCNRFTRVPPIMSKYVPKNLLIDIVYSNFAWWMYIIKRISKRVARRIAVLGNDENYFNYRYFKSNDKYTKHLFSDSYSFVCIPPEAKIIVLGPKYLEYPFQKKHKNEWYFQFSIDRCEKVYFSDEYRELLNEIRDRKEKGEKIIYFSTGTILTSNDKVKVLLEKIEEVARGLPHVFLIVSQSIKSDKKNDLGGRIKYYEFLPQLDLLKYVDLVITHGGTNTISECLQANVPVLCCPLSKNFDHWGNTARVIYHKIGDSIDAENDAISKIRNKVFQLLNKEEYKFRISAITNEDFSQEAQFQNLILFLNR